MTRPDPVSGLHASPQPGTGEPISLHDLRCGVLEAVATGQALDAIAATLCRTVERLAPAVACAVLIVDEAGLLHPLAAPSLPDAYVQALDGMSIGPAGPREAGAALGWAPFKTLPLAAGLRACWPSPVFGGDGRMVGVFACYVRHHRRASDSERWLIETSVHLCQMAIEHAERLGRLERTNNRFDMALSNMSQGVCFFDGNARLIVANRRYSEIYGLPPGSIAPGTDLRTIVGLRVAAGTGPVMASGDYLDWRDTVRTLHAASDTVVELANGRVVAIHHQPMSDAGWVATHEDITERRRAEAQLVYLARHDVLTKLPNRLMFCERLEQALALSGRGRSCAVLCLDLDQFKAVNDSFGHGVGDGLLQAVAERLQACVRDVDTVTRLGSDEFAILLVGIDRPESVGELAQRVVAGLSKMFDVEGHAIAVGVSIGIAIAPQDGSSAIKLLKNADTALERAKLDERGSYRFFEPDMDARLQARMALKRDLRLAVTDEAFELFYQPLYNLAADAICGFEALLRWRHPARGMVSPAEFIPLAEETGLIVPIGAWVLQRACAEAAGWPGSVKVAVNLSAVQFKSKTLLETVQTCLAQSGLPATRLELEITESTLLTESADTLATLHALRDLGISISMDDFGTGYSSLSYLRSFPFDKIKIDQSFTRDLSEKRDSIAIIRAIVSLGRSLGMVTTAEGVETAEQLAHLRREGCTEVQGYLFSRPVPAAAARAMLPGMAAMAAGSDAGATGD